MQEPLRHRIRAWVFVAVTAASIVGCASTSPTTPALSGAQIEAIVASPDRSAADRANDARRKPAETLAFIGVRPGMTALDVSAGGGYTTELLARAVGPSGRVYGQSAPPDPERAPPAVAEGGDAPRPAMPQAPRRTTAMALAERARNPAASSIVAVLAPFANPLPPALAPRSLDVVTLMFNYHDFGHMGVDRTAMNRAILAALKPGGVYVIADHAGRDGTGISESGTLHRVEAAFVVAEVEAAGFRLADRGTFLQNSNDPRDRNTPEPPQPKDGFILKFRKP